MKRWIERFRARGRYFAADRAAGDALAALAKASDAQDRMAALYELAEQTRVMAENAYGVRGSDVSNEDGWTLADICRAASWLAGLVADTEAVLVFGCQAEAATELVLPVSAEATVVLAQLRAETRVAARKALVMALHAAVRDQVGVHAAGVLISIANAYFHVARRQAWSVERREGGASR